MIIDSSFRKRFGQFEIISPASVSPELIVPEHIAKPPYYTTGQPTSSPSRAEIKSKEQINVMRESCRLAAEILNKCGNLISVGLTTDELDKYAHSEILKSSAYPSPLRYQGFPKSICTSVNNVACHGIPDSRKLKDGDIINVDITVFFKGFHGDCSKTFLVGNVDEMGRNLVKVAEECRDVGIAICGPDKMFKSIGGAVENHAVDLGYKVSPTFCGHGIGSYFHGPPDIFHVGNNFGGFMKPGMVFTVEPVVTMGSQEMEMLNDGWTIVSEDGARSAQFEHTILITESGFDILTVC